MSLYRPSLDRLQGILAPWRQGRQGWGQRKRHHFLWPYKGGGHIHDVGVAQKGLLGVSVLVELEPSEHVSIA